MRHCRFQVASCALGLALCATELAAEDVNRYREFQLKSTVAAVSIATGVAVSEIKVLHRRPAIIQELAWRPKYSARRSSPGQVEVAEQIGFHFYDDQLFRLTVNYDRERTRGLTDSDMIDAISAIYGPQVNLLVSRTPQGLPGDDEGRGKPIARWGDAQNSLILYRTSVYTTRYTLVMTAEPLAALARTARARAVALDVREAPQREAARQKKEAEDRRAVEETVRSTNKATFQP